jgi:poly-gamma-glutamate synthesis protein (capsule biosynthesis protein)
MKNKFTVNILGDICFTKDNTEIVNKVDSMLLFNDLHEVLSLSDFNVGNFEAPIPNETDKPIIKTGPALKNNANLLQILADSNFKALGLANNHIKDYGDSALINTIQIIENTGLQTFGAGIDKVEAAKPTYLNLGGKTLGFIAFAEYEFNIATDTSAGASHFDVFDSFDNIATAKSHCDYLIILFHGGIEYYRYPSPLLQRSCRKMVDSGANLVICQHSHCIGSKEEYNEGTIVYGQGNSLFGHKDGYDMWNQGVVVQLILSEEKFEIDYLPISAKPSGGISLMNSENAGNCLADFYERSMAIVNPEFVSENWTRFCMTKESAYMPQLIGFNRYLNFINRKTNNLLIKLWFTKRKYMISHNLLRCESHHEVLKTILRNSY